MKHILTVFLTVAAIAVFGQVTVNNQFSVKLDISDPIPSEKFAQKELKHYLGEIFGTTESVLNRKNGPSIILRYDKSLGLEEFNISSDKAGNIVIRGGRIRGVLLGTYYFLDRKLGVHWYSPYDEYVPKAKAIKVSGLPYKGKSVYKARLMLGHRDRQSRLWTARNLLTTNAVVKDPDPNLGEVSVFAPPNACHGMFLIIPGVKYKDHP